MSCKMISVLFFVTLIAASGSAQEPLFGVPHQMLPVAFDRTRSLALVDVDGDGDVDEVTGRGIALNDGTGIFTDATATCLPTSYGTSVLGIEDIDGDGDPDIMASDALHLNNGAGIFTDVTGTHLPTGFLVSSLALGDVDGDGDLDVFGGRIGQQNRLYLNGGSGTFSDVTATNMPVDSDGSAAVALGDMDGDGDLDAVIGNMVLSCNPFAYCYGVQNRVYLNDGTGVFSDVTASALPPYLGNTGELAFFDVDSDSDLDVIVGHTPGSNYPAPSLATGHNQLYINNGTGIFSIVQFPYSDITNALAIGDLNGDGTQDVIIGNGGPGQLVLYSPTGSPFASTLPPGFTGANALALGDVDGDGDLDVVVGKDGQDRIFLNDGTAVFLDTTPTVMPEVGDATNSATLADFDGDGDVDALFANIGQDRLLFNDGVGVFSDVTATHFPIEAESTTDLALGDVDGDGDLDVLTGGEVDAWWGCCGVPSRLYLNDGVGVFTDASATHWPQPPFVIGEPAACLGDVDGDGDLDALTSFGLYLNDGQGIFIDATATNLPAGHWAMSLALGDLDGDGDLDAILGDGDLLMGGPDKLYFNDGTGVFVDATASGLPPDVDATTAVALGDVDGDGDLDALFANGGWALSAQNRLYLNNGGGIFTDVTATNLPIVADESRDVQFVDADEDGDLDALFASSFGGGGQPTRLYLNDGTGVFTDGTVANLPRDESASHAVAFGDVDQDGDLDAMIGMQGINRLFINTTRHLAWHGLPRFGQPLSIGIRGPANESWVLCASFGTTYVPVDPVGILKLDLGTLIVLGGGSFDAQGRASFTLAIPANPGGIPSFTTYGQALVGSTDPRLTSLETFTFVNH